jgi:trimethylamine--corrinoid protein Co-methyltransferase
MDAVDVIAEAPTVGASANGAAGATDAGPGQGNRPPHRTAPYILRNIPTYDVLGEESLLRIEDTADRILAEIGIEFRDDPVALEHWKSAGADVDGLLVRFEPGMLREILKSAPASFTQHAGIPPTASRSAARALSSPRLMDLRL